MPAPAVKTLLTLLKFLAMLVLPVLIVALAVWGARRLVATMKPRPEPPPRQVVIQVDLIEAAPTNARYEVASEGTVRPMWEAALPAEVSGRVLWVAPALQAGRLVRGGEPLVRIEPVDYETAVARAEAERSTAEQRLAEEEARARQARREWERSGRELADAPDLTLRKPQVAAATASLRAAESALVAAERDLERCEVRAPFDAVVDRREVSPGDVVGPSQDLGRLIGVERFEVPLVLSPFQAARLDLPHGGASNAVPITLTAPTRPGAGWPAEITRVEARLDTRNRFVRVVAEVPGPYADPSRPLPVGTFVQATIPGPVIVGLHRVPESALVDDRLVWSVDGGMLLVRHEVERVFSRDVSAFVRFADGGAPHRVVDRPLPNFHAGQQVADAAAPPAPRSSRDGEGGPGPPSRTKGQTAP